nr:MAG TPA: hypothetical protein [Caudoviricetes sp.]
MKINQKRERKKHDFQTQKTMHIFLKIQEDKIMLYMQKQRL